MPNQSDRLPDGVVLYEQSGFADQLGIKNFWELDEWQERISRGQRILPRSFWAKIKDPDPGGWDGVMPSNVLVNPDAPLNTPPWANAVIQFVDDRNLRR